MKRFSMCVSPKNYLKGIFGSLLLTTIFLFSGVISKANHINGIDLGYSYVSGNTYRITLTLYGNCAASTFGSLATATPTICIFDSSSYLASINLTLTGPGVKVSNVCPRDTDSTTCTSTSYTLAGTEKFVYTGTYTLPDTAKCWRFVFTGVMGSVSAGRVATTNLSGAITIAYLVDTLNNLTSKNVNTPDLTVIPTPYYCENNPDNYNPGAIDPDGDSLVFALDTLKTNNGGSCTTAPHNVTYTAGYSVANPVPYTAGTYSFNTSTGQISFNPNLTGTFAADYNIRKYRGGVVVGTMQRELYFLIQVCSTPPPKGAITGATVGTVVDSVQYEVCRGSGPFTFNITPTETDTFNTITVTATGVPAWGALTITGNGTNHPSVSFTANANTAPLGTYHFTLNYLDNNCPISGSNTIAYYFTINPLPVPVTCAKDSICVASGISYVDTSSGGTWSSTATSIATVNASTGAITGISAGLDTIKYTITATGCFSDTVLIVDPLPKVITGTMSICEGTTTTLADSTTGGNWTVTNTIATIGVSSGVATAGFTAGVDTVSYTLPTGCRTGTTITVNTAPGPIMGPDSTICVGATLSLSDAVGSGTWSSSATGIATVNASGVVTGIATGVANITYAVGSCFVTNHVTVNPVPAAIVGTLSLCVGNTVTYTDATGGGAWSSNSVTAATVGSGTGVVHAVAAGTATISYTNSSTGCYVTAQATVNITPVAITATSTSVCVGSTITYTDATAGGAWSSSSVAAATVVGGDVTGAAAGTAIITYAIGACYQTQGVTVNPNPAAIVGALSLCVGNTVTYTDATGGGAWSSNSVTIATVGGGTGVVHALAVGNANISYTLSGTGCYVASQVTVNTTPVAIAAPVTAVCAGSTITYTDATAGGAWTSSSVAAATVSGGDVTGVAAGIATISYSIGSCYQTQNVTVNPTPAAIAGPTSVCIGSTITLTDATPGAVWSSSAPGTATITAGGVVTGMAAGTAIITYQFAATGCDQTYTVNVVALPASITGTLGFCNGSTTTLSDGTSGGTWSSGTTSVATVNPSGVVSGLTVGTSVITYTVGTGCFVETMVTVNTTPVAITGTLSICNGTSSTLADATPGGTWSSLTTTVATITAGGVATGAGVGTSVISYTLLDGCAATSTVTVNTTPAAIGGTLWVCNGFTSPLNDPTVGGNWSSVTPGTATISAGGVVTGHGVGTSVISYTIGSCAATAIFTVDLQPAAITGTFAICNLTSTTLADATPGGSWSSITPGVASISGVGVVTAASVGTTLISYTIGSCAATVTESVNALPNPGLIAAGSGSACIGFTLPLTDGVAGGIWSSVSTGIATINATGVVTGITNGTDSIKYTVTNGCGTAFASTIITINPSPSAAPVTGTSALCVGTLVTLSDVTAGGVWSSPAPGVATISATGVVTGTGAGTDLISYGVTNSCGTVYSTFMVTVNAAPAPAAIGGPASICVGSFANYTDVTGSGVWSISNTDATISATGVVTAVSAGVDTVSYTVTNMCGVTSVTKAVSLNPLPVGAPVTGLTTLCQLATVTLADANPGGTWHVTNGDASVSAGGVVTGIRGGTDTVYYSLTNSCGTTNDSLVVTINPLPDPGTITGLGELCVGTTITISDPVIGGTYAVSNSNATFVPATGVVTGVAAGVDTISYSLTNICGTATTDKIVTVLPLPGGAVISGPDSVCVGSHITLTDAVSGGSWSKTNTNANISATGVVTGVVAGMDTIIYSITTICGTSIDSYTVVINPLPGAGVISGSSEICVGALTTLSSTVSGGVWSLTNTNASIGSSSGIVLGNTEGRDTVKYTVTNVCGTAVGSMPVTINPFPSAGVISGPNNVCQGATISLTETIPGGTWSSSTAITSVSSTGVVTGVSGGTDSVTYTISNACGTVGTYQLIHVIALPAPGALASPGMVCIGTSVTLIDTPTGGTWSTSNASIATVAGGIVTGVAVGLDTIKYALSNSCGTVTASTTLNVVAFPTVASISGPSSVCTAANITLLDMTTGGSWSLSNGNASLLAPGIVAGVSAGLDTAYYSVTNACGTVVASKAITVNLTPAVGAISGGGLICTGSVTTLTDSSAGGVWSSSHPTIVSVAPSSGLITAIASGTATISYSVTSAAGCPATAFTVVTVDVAPYVPAITGATGECIGNSGTVYDSLAGGTWSVSDGTIAMISPTGVITSLAAGVVTITYSVPDICGVAIVTTTNTVHGLPVVGPILGVLNSCPGVMNALSDTTLGGIWSSTATSVATVNPTTGVVSGVAGGTAVINYSVTNAWGCTTTQNATYTVLAAPAVASITGITNECVGGTQTLADATSGGVWTGSNSTIATVSTGGVVTGLAMGIDTIAYTVTSGAGCATSAIVYDTVNVIPTVTPITGATSFCQGTVTTLSNSILWGAWTSGNTSIATANAGTGVISGVAAGTAEIYYNVLNSCGSVTDSISVTVKYAPTVDAITGSTTTLCAGSSTTLADGSAGGAWTSSDTTLATIGRTNGIVHGIAAGSVTFTYTITNSNSCSADATYAMNFNSSIGSSYVTPSSGSICAGHTLNMQVITSGGGLTYQWLINGHPIAGATTYSYSADSVGVYSVIISNGTCTETLSGPDVTAMSSPSITFTAPNILSVGAYAHYQWYLNGNPIPGATNSTYHEGAVGIYKVEVTDGSGCTLTSLGYTVHGGGGSGGGSGVAVINAEQIRMYPNPANNEVIIDAPASVNVRILSPDGQEVMALSNAGNIDIHTLAAGMYIIMVYDENNLLVKTDKLVKIN